MFQRSDFSAASPAAWDPLLTARTAHNNIDALRRMLDDTRVKALGVDQQTHMKLVVQLIVRALEQVRTAFSSLADCGIDELT